MEIDDEIAALEKKLAEVKAKKAKVDRNTAIKEALSMFPEPQDDVSTMTVRHGGYVITLSWEWAG